MAWIGLSKLRTTSPSGAGGLIASRFSATVLPVTVRQSPCSSPASSSAFMTTGTPPCRSTSFMTYWPNGLRSPRCGTRSAIRLKSASCRSTSASWAMASRCSTTFVDPPYAITTAIAFSNASLVMMSRAVMPEPQQVHDGLAGAVREVVAAAVGAGRGGRAGHAHPERLGDAGHGVGGVHAAAGALAGGDGAFDAVQVVQRHRAGLARADRLVGVDDRDVLLGAVAELDPAGRDRAGVEEDGCQVQPRGGHQHPGQRLVASGEQHGAVEPLGLHDDLDRVGDDLAADQREVHALVPHRDAVGHRDGAELQRVAAAGVHALLGRLRESREGQVARRDLVPRTRRCRSAACPSPRRPCRRRGACRGMLTFRCRL